MDATRTALSRAPAIVCRPRSGRQTMDPFWSRAWMAIRPKSPMPGRRCKRRDAVEVSGTRRVQRRSALAAPHQELGIPTAWLPQRTARDWTAVGGRWGSGLRHPRVRCTRYRAGFRHGKSVPRARRHGRSHRTTLPSGHATRYVSWQRRAPSRQNALHPRRRHDRCRSSRAEEVDQ